MKTINKIFWSALILLVVYTILVLVPTPVNFSITGFVAEGRLPTIGESNWGTILNTYLTQEHTAEGGHKNVTIQGSLDVDGNGNFTGDLNVTGNLTIGDKITFRLGEVIDNIVDGWLVATGNLNVIGDLNVSGEINSTGLNVDGNAKFEKNINVTGNLTISGDIGSGTPDVNTLYAKALPKAWVNFDGTGCSGNGGSCTDGTVCTVADSFNIDCVNKTGTGNYIVYWDRDFANVNYVVSLSYNSQDLTDYDSFDHFSPSGGSIIMRYYSGGSPQDSNSIHVIAFGEQ